MARLSKRGFNNVVIFAMLGMIFLFNLERFVPESKLPVTLPLLPESAHVLKIEQSNYKLERVGQQWRWNGVNRTFETTPEAQINAWRSAVMQAAKPPREVTQTEPLIAVVWVAGETQGLVYAFVAKDQTVWVQYAQQWYSIDNTRLAQLLPWQTDNQEM
ncbi:hypothetical protein [Alteromonas lipolytica]|uniref:DUF4340 domain-containing protein n=1 Tax=Alteromonas lipolytica TaxID=1856405 RepID=A0A1E8FI37_9ALTE|nr:hypothetical protein [Alteromonas lipolytica]OFI35406.1 hypothetical protein BFC17_11580 [Alteromonas lipolytica]GGF76034.1 hypothetical protein GCM10011338_30180 [Alteromonas lipolytica]